MRSLLPALLVLSGGCSEWHLFGIGQHVQTDTEDTGQPDETDEPEGCAGALEALQGAEVLLDDREADIGLSTPWPVGEDSPLLWLPLGNHESQTTSGVYLISHSSWQAEVFEPSGHPGILSTEEIYAAGLHRTSIRSEAGSEGLWLRHQSGSQPVGFTFYASPPDELVASTDYDALVTTYVDDDVWTSTNLVTADLDGDGLDEAAVYYRVAGEDGFYSVMTSPYPALWDSWADDAWRLEVPREAGSLDYWPVAADIDGDGYDDLVAGGSDVWGETYYDDGALWVLYGPFADGRDLSVPDAAVQNDALTSHLGGTSGRSPTVGTDILTPGDVDGDGLDDLVFPAVDHTDDQERTIWYAWTPEPGVHEVEELDRGIRFSPGPHWQSWDMGDINGDAQPDFFFTQRGTWTTTEGDPDEPKTVALLTSPMSDMLTEDDLDHVSQFDRSNRWGFFAMGGGDLTGDGLDDMVFLLPSDPNTLENPDELLLLAGCEEW